jgi:hypothetical protein
VDEAHKKAQEHREKYGIRKLTKPINQHGVYSFSLQDRDKNWWEIQYAPHQHEACFARGESRLCSWGQFHLQDDAKSQYCIVIWRVVDLSVAM